jgi:hypothetical protein
LAEADFIATGFLFGIPDGLNFTTEKPYTACRLCGAVFQGPLDLKVPPGHEPENSMIARLAKLKRDDWARTHARREHTQNEHDDLKRSGRFATPIAAGRLSAMGIFSIIDMVTDDEVASALKEAKAIPDREVENGR